MSKKEIIQSYYDSLNQKDEKQQALWSEDAVFSDASLTFHAQGKEAVIQSFIRLLNVVEGVKIKHMIVEGLMSLFIQILRHRGHFLANRTRSDGKR